MKFNKQINNGTLLIPGGAFKISGFEGGEKVEIHTLDSAVVVLKKQMTTMELIQAMDALHLLATELTVHLARVCGTCDDCEDGCQTTCGKTPASLPGPSSVSMWMTKKRPSPLPRPDMTMTCGMCLPTCWRCWVKPESAWASWRNS